MSERVGEQVETVPLAPDQVERLARYGEHLVTGILPLAEPATDRGAHLETSFRRNPSWQEHQLDISLTGMLVGQLNMTFLEGNGVSQLFLNLHYLFPRTYLVASRAPNRLTPIRVTGHSYFIDSHLTVGAVGHVREVFEDDGSQTIPLWAFRALSNYRERPHAVVRAYRASDAVSAFQRTLNRGALNGIQRIYDEVATEYGFIDFRQFRWQQFQPRAA